MTSVATPSTIPTDSPEARRYNRIKRWLGIADFVLGLILLLALLVTGWSGTLRDLAYSEGFLVGVILASIVTELLYFIIREAPQHWWLLAWAAFLGLFVLVAQIAPVVLFPIFYKFEPLEDEELKSRLVRLSQSAGTRVRGVYKWKLSEKSKKANAALTGLGSTRRIILADTLLDSYSPDEIEAVLARS